MKIEGWAVIYKDRDTRGEFRLMEFRADRATAQEIFDDERSHFLPDEEIKIVPATLTIKEKP